MGNLINNNNNKQNNVITDKTKQVYFPFAHRLNTLEYKGFIRILKLYDEQYENENKLLELTINDDDELVKYLHLNVEFPKQIFKDANNFVLYFDEKKTCKFNKFKLKLTSYKKTTYYLTKKNNIVEIMSTEINDTKNELYICKDVTSNKIFYLNKNEIYEHAINFNLHKYNYVTQNFFVDGQSLYWQRPEYVGKLKNGNLLFTKEIISYDDCKNALFVVSKQNVCDKNNIPIKNIIKKPYDDCYITTCHKVFDYYVYKKNYLKYVVDIDYVNQYHNLVFLKIIIVLLMILSKSL